MLPTSPAPYALVATLVFVSYVLARLARGTGLPPAGALVVVGVVTASLVPRDSTFTLNPASLGLVLPALVFEAAWDIDARALRRSAAAIAVLAVPGVVLTAGIIGLGAWSSRELDLPSALLLGAILAATDPVAVLALFRRIAVPAELFTIVAGESIANDGVAVVLSTALIPIAAGAARLANPGDVGAIALAGLRVSAVGIGAGIAVAFAAAFALRRATGSRGRIATTLAVAYAAYGTATLLGGSGIFASAAAGVALPALGHDRRDERDVERFWDRVADVANAIVFLLVGLNLRLERITSEPGLVAATVVATLAARLALSYAVAPVGRREGWRHTIALAGLRGGLSLALALGLPPDLPGRPRIIDAVFAVVFLTLVVQGTAIGPLLRKLRVADA